MTNCIVISERPKSKSKPVEFTNLVAGHLTLINAFVAKPKDYGNIELLWHLKGLEKDLILAYDTDRSQGNLYLGHWNDGFVE